MIHKIINSLLDSEKSLADALLKTQYLAKKIGNSSLYDWTMDEINGYKGSNKLPTYRIIKCQALGVLTQDNVTYNEGPLPIRAFNSEKANFLEIFEVDNGVASMEYLSSKADDTIMERSFSSDVCYLLTTLARENGRKFRVKSARSIFSSSEFADILTKIRSYLLDLMTELDENFPDIDKDFIKIGKSEEEQINNLIHIIMPHINNINGDGNIINNGKNSTITNNATISKGSKENLKNYFKENHVEESDIEQLLAVVDDEIPTSSESFGSKVNDWMTKMYLKAADGTWQVGIGAAGGILAEGIMRYYGFK